MQAAKGGLSFNLSSPTTMSIYANNSATSSTLKPDFAQLQQALFQKADSDGDGQLSQDELQAMITKNPRLAKALASLAPTADGSTPTLADIMKKLDADGDGKISPAELTAGLKQARTNLRGHRLAPGQGNDGDQDDAGGSTASADKDKELKTLLEQFLAKLQEANGLPGSSATDSPTSATTATDTAGSTVNSDKTLTDLLSEILAKMRQQNGYAQNGTTQTAAGTSPAILQTLA